MSARHRLPEVRDEQDVDPGVHGETSAPGSGHQTREGVEVPRLALEKDAPGDDPGRVERVPPPTNLDEESVEAGLRRLVDHTIDAFGGDEGGPDDPQAAQLGEGRGGGGRGGADQDGNQGAARRRRRHSVDPSSRPAARASFLSTPGDEL
jgi:hypothetical protein